MKRLLILLLLLPSLAWGQDYARMNPYILGGGVSAAAYSFGCASATSSNNTSGLLCEDFDNPSTQDCNAGDGLNCRAAWTGTKGGSPNFAYAGDTGHALFLDGSSEDTADARTFTEGTTDPQYWYFTVKFTALVNDGVAIHNILNVKYNNCGSDLGYIRVYTETGANWVLGVQGFGGTTGYTTTTITTNTLYHVWLKIVRETGDGSVNNAKIILMFSTTATPPTDWATCEGGSPHASCAKSVNGQRQAYADCINPVGQYGGSGEYTSMAVDNILVSSTDFGDNP